MQSHNTGRLPSGGGPGCGGLSASQWWRQLWRPQSMSVRERCPCFVASPAYLQIDCGAMLTRTTAGHVVLTKPCQVSFSLSLHLVMARKFNNPLHLFSDLGTWFLTVSLCFLCCGVPVAFFEYFGHFQHHVHVRLAQLYFSSLPWDSTRHVKIRQDISCCF
jgi:hypothetical protein